MSTAFLTTERILTAYIRTGLKPLHGAKAWFDTDHPLPPTCACPIAVICVDAGTKPHNMDSTQLYEHFQEPFNPCWVDGFTAAWEETSQGRGLDEAHTREYTLEENPQGRALFMEGYANGQRVRQDFVNLGLRVA